MHNTHIERFAVFSDVAPGNTVMVPLETTMPEKATSCGGEKTRNCASHKIVYLNAGNVFRLVLYVPDINDAEQIAQSLTGHVQEIFQRPCKGKKFTFKKI